jgi:polyphosphate kinase 2 (PPK2 family)
MDRSQHAEPLDAKYNVKAIEWEHVPVKGEIIVIDLHWYTRTGTAAINAITIGNNYAETMSWCD